MDVVIYDDDTEYCDFLRKTIEKLFVGLNITIATGEYNELKKHISFIEKPTIFLLDIMANKQPLGFRVSDYIEELGITSLTIFVTDFPSKISSETLYKMKAHNVILKKSPKFEEEIKLTISSAFNVLSNENLFIYKDKFSTVSVPIDGIMYVETNKGKNKIVIHHQNGIFEMRQSLDKLEQMLPNYFVRCHNSYIVNVRKIRYINHNNFEIIMENRAICRYSYFKKSKLFDNFK